MHYEISTLSNFSLSHFALYAAISSVADKFSAVISDFAVLGFSLIFSFQECPHSSVYPNTLSTR